MPPSPEPASEPRAKWGDRVGRRRDILRAAAERLERDGYDEFNVRAIARGAGVSAATLYSYFPTKNDIFAALMVQRFDELRVALDELGDPATKTLEDLFVAVVPELVDLHRHFGRHIHEWTRGEREESATVTSAKRAFVEATGALERVLHRAAANEGAALDPSPLLLPYVWSALFGLAYQHSHNMTGTLGYGRDELTRYAARALARSVAR